ncbi:hypothetical protein [Streptomyces indicus]|nr:hypothetical protein [Streptomyces indicus]
MRIQAQKEACLSLIESSHAMPEAVYPALIHLLRNGISETPPDFLKNERAAIRSAVSRLELEGPTELIPLAHRILDEAAGIDETCMMQIPALEAIYHLAGGLVRKSRFFSFSTQWAESCSLEALTLDEIRYTVVYSEDAATILEALRPLVSGGYLSQFDAHEISTCDWDFLVGVDGGIHCYLDDALEEFTKAAHSYVVESSRLQFSDQRRTRYRLAFWRRQAHGGRDGGVPGSDWRTSTGPESSARR